MIINPQNNTLNNAEIYNFSLTSKTGETFDLTNKFANIDIYEDMFSYFLTAIVSIIDSNDIVKNYPIVGGEIVQMLWSDSISNSARDITMVVDSVLPQIEQTVETRANKVVLLKLITIDAIACEQVRVSKTYNTENSSPITLGGLIDLQLAYTSTEINPVNVSQSLSSKSFPITLNRWNLHDLIDFILSQTEDAFFFQQFDHYKLASLQDLLSQSSIAEFVMGDNLESRANFNAVYKFHFESFFDINIMYQMGGFGKTVYNIDLEKYNADKQSKTLYEIYEKYPKLGQNQIFRKELSSNQTVIGTNFNDKDAALKRNIIIQSLANHNLICQMGGSVKRNVGDIITFNVPSWDNKLINDNYQGNWLITQIKHSISNLLVYNQNVRLWKNAFFNNRKVG